MSPASEVRSAGDTTFILERHNTDLSTISSSSDSNNNSHNQSAIDRNTTNNHSRLDTNSNKPSSTDSDTNKNNPNSIDSNTNNSNPSSMAANPTPAPPSVGAAPSRTSGDIVCPDPTAHRDTKLQEQASSAALYVTKPAKQTNPRDGILDANNKLSSRSAAASLKYADPRDLPSYPTVGINTAGSANAAANLANSNQKPFEHWKPGASSAAGAAAMLAKDYKMAPMWQPELSAAGSKAALIAHKDGAKLNLWMPEATAEGNSAAGLAMRNKTLSPQLDYGYTDDGRKRALLAATGALGRSQSLKSPPTKLPQYPDAANSAHNALNAATVVARRATVKSASRPNVDANRIDSEALRAARVQNLGQNVSRDMFTERPPVDMEVEEKKKQAALRASAVSMAKQMYDQSEKKRRDEEAADLQERIGTSAAAMVHNRAPSAASTQPDLRQQAMQYIHLQEAAQKLASERLEKMDPDGVARYRAHYGYEPQSPRSRLSLRNRPSRRRAESNPNPDAEDDSSDDDLRSRRIRNQMSNLNDSVAEQDKKRQQDRASLLAAAEKRVQAQMHNMDERVFQETGKVTPQMMDDWEAKARARAAADSETRQRNFGKVSIGGGKYMDQAELDAIAQSRLQPTLNEIHDTAEKKRARDEELRLDQEEKRRQEQSEKGREKEVKAEQKRLKEQEKAEAKAAKKMEKELEKNRKAEEKLRAKEEKRRSKDAKREAADAAAASSAAHEADKHIATSPTSAGTDTAASTTAIAPKDTSDDAERDVDADPTPAAEVIPDTDGAPLDKTDSPDLMTRIETGGTHYSTQSGLRPELDRHVSAIVSSSSSSASTDLSDSEHEADEPRPVATEPEPSTATTVPQRRKSGRLSGLFSRFRAKSKSKPDAPATDEPQISIHVQDTSDRMATSAGPAIPVVADTASSSSFRRHEVDLHSISSLSSDEEDAARRGRSSAGISRGEEDEDEEFEEARDTFDEALAPPPSFGGSLKSSSPVRETRFQEAL